MTSFENNDGNPYGRASPWPKMPQGPFRVGGPMGAAVGRPEPAARPQVAPEPPERVIEPLIEPPMALEAPEPEPRAFTIPPEPAMQAAAIVTPIAARRRAAPARGLRLTPLVAAAAVGAGGMLALVLVLGVGRPAATVQPAAQPQTLAVGALVGQSPTPPATEASVAPPPAPVAKATAPKLALAAQPKPPSAGAGAKLAEAPSPPPMLAIPAPASSVPTQSQLPAARPVASLVGPAEPPLATPAPAFTPKAAPDPSAPIVTHAPDTD